MCEIVLKDGEGAISHTCHTFPREEQHYTGRIERGLTPGCPAVVDLMWGQDQFRLQEREENSQGIVDEICEINPVLFEIRDWFLEIVNTPEVALKQRWKSVFRSHWIWMNWSRKVCWKKSFHAIKERQTLKKFKRSSGQIWI
ncbi:MAG: hypothetical protein ACLSCU_02870 [Eubacterium sp.]